MKKNILLFVISIFIISCDGQSNSNYNYSEKETEEFLNQVTKNAKSSITDFTEFNRKPTDEFELTTRYPLSKDRLEEYKRNNGTIINKDNDISDFTIYTFKSYELINEKNEKLKFVDNGRAVYLQEYGLWDYNNILNQNLGISFKLDKKFETLNGFITIEFEIPNKMKKEINLPVKISINDKTSE